MRKAAQTKTDVTTCGFSAQTICSAGADLKGDYAGYVARRT
jgi:hypothetical protein